MISRRSFLIGSGSLLTSPFVEKATWYLEEKQSVVPLIEPNKSLNKLYFVPLSDEYELRLGSPDLNNESFRKNYRPDCRIHFNGDGLLCGQRTRFIERIAECG